MYCDSALLHGTRINFKFIQFKKDMQYAYRVTMRGVRVAMVAVEKQ